MKKNVLTSQSNKLGQIYVKWYIKTQILRYVSACSIARKTYCPNSTLCNGPIYHISDRADMTDRAEIADIDGKSEILTDSLTTH